MKIISKKLSGSALLISLLILASIFIIAFGAGYLSFFNAKNADLYQQSARARLAAEAGVERMRWELGHNDFNLETQCGSRILETDMDLGYYYLKCTLDANNSPRVQAVGVYKNSSVVLDTGFCYDADVECSSSCLIGSLCGGGVLFSIDPLIVSAPSACTDVGGTDCDNSFSDVDTISLAWDDAVTPSSTTAIDESDGRVNASLLAGANYLGSNFCADLAINSFSDWYLPAKNELDLMVRNSNYCTQNSQGPIPLCQHGTSTSPIIDGFSGVGPYLSSTEYSSDGYFSQRFVDGASATSTKSVGALLRCLRRPI
ncbi:MAG: hypothetical protein WC564_04405 [Patescibacteria group bacterium]